MAFSYSRLLLENTELKIYHRGLDYANSRKIAISKMLNNACIAIAKGKDSYDVSLGFSHIGSLKYLCSCPYFQENTKVICKHIVAAALVWDRLRKVPDPDGETIESLCIPEPTITRKDINKAYADPLHADLEVFRRASDEMRWTRSHARLPLIPRICKKPLKDPGEVKKGISELRAWSRKYSFDPYFCAGEMVAGYCELIRWVASSHSNLSWQEAMRIAQLLVDYHLELIQQTIDDSDGLHEFTEAHLVHFIEIITKKYGPLSTQNQKEIRDILTKITDY